MVTDSNAANTYVFKLRRGATWNRKITVENLPDQLAADFSGLTSSTMELRKEKDSATPDLVLSLGNGIARTGSDFVISLTATQSAALTASAYYYTWKMNFSAYVYFPLDGKFQMTNGG